MARIKSIPWNDRSNNFAVMVRVTAPSRNESSRAAVDLVAVLDISGSMRGPRLESMKQAMMFVIDSLGYDDRLSVVAFDNHAQRITELSVMSNENKQRARAEVLNLRERGGTDMIKGMQEAAKILGQRRPDEKITRAGRIIFLSDGEDASVLQRTKEISSEYPADTFGLDAGHDPKVLRCIADQTLGIYSYVNQDLNKIKSAFAQSIGGITSITAMDLQIKLKTHDGVNISSIESGSYPKSISSDGRSGTIHVHDMYAGEQKNFIVFLTIPEGRKKLMSISGCYRNPKIRNGGSIPLDDNEVAIRRPWWSIFTDDTVNPEVAAELTRQQLVKGVSAIAVGEHPAADSIQRLWDKIRGSDDGRMTPEQTLENLGEEVTGMKKEGKPFILSWLTSHLWQRATTKGSPSESSAFQTIEMIKKVRIAENKTPVQEKIPNHVGKVKTKFGVVISRARSNSNYCALACIVLMLLAGTILPMLWHKGAPAIKEQPTPGGPVDESDEERNITMVDVSKHQAWLKLEESLEAVMLKKMEDTGITSFFHGASAADVSHDTSRYILLALVHASVLGSRCNSAPTIALLEQKVERLEAEKTDLSVKIEALVKEKAEEAANCTACCEDNDEALERANTRIVELERQLQDKKAFAESLMLEVANADAHLKTCNQRVDKLEAKVRDMEGTIIGQ
ncbi:hypothetical protein EJB05_34106, partial [Eragrostis curvula]